MSCDSCANGSCITCGTSKEENDKVEYDADGEVIVKGFPHKNCPCLTEECKCKERLHYYIS